MRAERTKHLTMVLADVQCRVCVYLWLSSLPEGEPDVAGLLQHCRALGLVWGRSGQVHHYLGTGRDNTQHRTDKVVNSETGRYQVNVMYNIHVLVHAHELCIEVR